MAITAQMISDDRGSERYAVDLDATLRDRVAQPYDVVIEDLSATGFRLSGGPALTTGAVASIGFAGIGVHPVRVIRQEGMTYGCEFVTPLNAEMLNKALVSAPSDPLAFPNQEMLLSEPVPEPYVEPYSGAAKVTIAVVAGLGAWAVATGLYFALA
ncbi:PilZ domain-containing protein [Sphingomonas sp. Leaf21]|uniref:PilZ domain-containing protein n=1 Tax=Sphingomonas sp. Leaf21 TaxID=2876550 RepID=UPI001E5EA705|nr:PilZ domain-containing protein [Sphingomonas sp. Leaf21]